MENENVRYDDEGRKMFEVGRYIVNTTKDHIDFFNIVRGNIRARDNIQTDYQSMLDSILTLAYNMSNGNFEKNQEDLEYEIMNEYFSQTMPQQVLDGIHYCVSHILEYYVKVIFNLGIVSGRVMFLHDIGPKGITLAEYNVEYLKK